MDCSQLNEYLDRLMDDELTRDELEALERHAECCEACASELAATRKLKNLMSEVAPELDVPLDAQAGWRTAVRAEAAKRSRARRYRYAGGIAAALVVLLGVGLLLRPGAGDIAVKSVERESAAEVEYAPEAATGGAMIEADGVEDFEAPMMAMNVASEAVDSAAEAADLALDEADSAAYEEAAALDSEEEIASIADAVPMHEITMTVGDLDEACGYLFDLIREYDGTLEEQRYETDGAHCANLFIELPGENVREFLESAAHYDSSDESIGVPEAEGSGMVSLLMVVRAS